MRRRLLVRRRRLRGLSLDFRGPEGRAGNVEYHSADAGFFKAVLFLPFVALYALQTSYDAVRSLVAHARGEPWVVEAQLDAMRRDVLVWRVVGSARSRQVCREAVAALARGDELTSAGEPERSVAGGAG